MSPPTTLVDALEGSRTPGSRVAADRAPRLPPASGTSSLEIEILSAFCEFSRLCRPENFRLGRNADPTSCATGVRRPAGTATSRIVWRPLPFAPHAGDRALALSSRRELNAVGVGHAQRSGTREVKSGQSEQPSAYSFFQKDKSTNLSEAEFPVQRYRELIHGEEGIRRRSKIIESIDAVMAGLFPAIHMVERKYS
jgi:hypothetical protein